MNIKKKEYEKLVLKTEVIETEEFCDMGSAADDNTIGFPSIWGDN
jgi:hypothetical protein